MVSARKKHYFCGAASEKYLGIHCGKSAKITCSNLGEITANQIMGDRVILIFYVFDGVNQGECNVSLQA